MYCIIDKTLLLCNTLKILTGNAVKHFIPKTVIINKLCRFSADSLAEGLRLFYQWLLNEKRLAAMGDLDCCVWGIVGIHCKETKQPSD